MIRIRWRSKYMVRICREWTDAITWIIYKFVTWIPLTDICTIDDTCCGCSSWIFNTVSLWTVSWINWIYCWISCCRCSYTTWLSYCFLNINSNWNIVFRTICISDFNCCITNIIIRYFMTILTKFTSFWINYSSITIIIFIRTICTVTLDDTIHPFNCRLCIICKSDSLGWIKVIFVVIVIYTFLRTQGR